MAILIDNRQKQHPVDRNQVTRTATAALDALGCPDAELSIVLVDDAEIQMLNHQYRGKDSPTNVLAFAMREGQFSDFSPGLLGDVVISLETVAREAAAAGMPSSRRFTELLIHGILHLVGFDHETGETDALIMEEKTGWLLSLVTDGWTPSQDAP